MSAHEEAVVSCETTKGSITMRFYRDWSPNGYDRVVGLFERHFFDESHFFRVLPSNLVQFGISYSEDEGLQEWAKSPIVDDPHREDIPFNRSIISFAGNGPNSRTSQLFITYQPNEHLGRDVWEVPVGKVVDDGMDEVVDNLYSYGDSPPWGDGPSQHEIHGNPNYIMTNFPKTDAFGTCFVKRYDELELVKEELLAKVTAAYEQKQQKELEAQQQQQQDETTTDGVLTAENHIAYLLDGDQSTLQLLGLSAISVIAALLLVVIVVMKNNKNSKSNSTSTSTANSSSAESGTNRNKTKENDDGDNSENEEESKKAK